MSFKRKYRANEVFAQSNDGAAFTGRGLNCKFGWTCSSTTQDLFWSSFNWKTLVQFPFIVTMDFQVWIIFDNLIYGYCSSKKSPFVAQLTPNTRSWRFNWHQSNAYKIKQLTFITNWVGIVFNYSLSIFPFSDSVWRRFYTNWAIYALVRFILY